MYHNGVAFVDMFITNANIKNLLVAPTSNLKNLYITTVKEYFMLDIKRVIKVIDWLIFEKKAKTRKDLAKKMGYTESSISQILNQKVPLSERFINNLSIIDERINSDWLLTGDGEMLKEKTGYGDGEELKKVTSPIPPEEEPPPRRLIPFYDDVSTIGGINRLGASMDAVFGPDEYIDTGDWFRDASAAIRHYGESMVEYPTGCILAIKEVQDRELIIPGRDYVIETSEYRVTKRIQKGKDPEHFTAYSTNPETYVDGRLIHEPFDIAWSAVRHISSVLGYVVKKNGETMMFSNQKTK